MGTITDFCRILNFLLSVKCRQRSHASLNLLGHHPG